MVDDGKTPKKSVPSDLVIKIATGSGWGKILQTETIKWPDFVSRLSKAPIDELSHASYLKLTKQERLKRKARRGYYILADIAGHERTNVAVQARSGIQLDVEGSDASLETIQAVLKRWQFFAHSTRSSVAGDRRYRVVLPYDASLEDMMIHKALVNYLCDSLELYGIALDRQSSIVLSQPAFFPTVSSDQEFEHVFNAGTEILSPTKSSIQLDKPPQAQTTGLVTQTDLKPKVDLTPDQIKNLLTYLDEPEIVDDYWAWIKTGQALYHQFDGSHDGFELWDEWSSNGSTYPGPTELERKWGSFHVAGPQTVTVASLMREAKKRGWQRDTSPQSIAEMAPQPLVLGDIAALPRRQWLLGRRLMRGYISLLSAPGGTGKSVMNLTTAVAVALGRGDLIGEKVHERVKVWCINWEDDQMELQRRLWGVVQHHGVDPKDLAGWLSVDSWYGLKGRKLAVEADRQVVATAIAEHIAEHAKAQGIGLIILDPLISIHTVNENDNGAMDAVFNVLRQIAAHTNAAVLVANHTAKGSGVDSEAHAGSSDAGRGAGAQRDAARFLHTLARMNADTAKKLGMEPEEACRYIRMDSAKVNFALPDALAHWYRLDTVSLLNGDEVGVPVPFDMQVVVEAAERRKAQTLEVQGEEWRVQVVEAMAGTQERVSVAAQSMALKWDRNKETARARIMGVFPVGAMNAVNVTTLEGAFLVWLEEGSGPTSPVNLCKKIAEKDAKD